MKRKMESKMTLSKETLRTLTQEDCRAANAAEGSLSYSACPATGAGCCQNT